jgi:hypothetical protein
VSIHLAEMDGAFAALRDAQVTRTRLVDGFETSTFGDSRAVSNFGDLDALSLATRAGLDRAVVALSFDLRTEDREKPGYLTRVYETQWLFVSPYQGATVEDEFVAYVERWENSWAQVETLPVTLGALTITFDGVAVLSDAPFAVIPNENYEVLGHTAIKRLSMEVEVCVRNVA